MNLVHWVEEDDDWESESDVLLGPAFAAALPSEFGVAFCLPFLRYRNWNWSEYPGQGSPYM